MIYLQSKFEKITSTTLGDTPQQKGPDPTIAHTHTILCSSLAVYTLGTFLAVLAREWIDNSANVDTDESATDHNRHRQIKMDGMERWHFDLVMRSFSFVFQIATLLLCYALSSYLFPTNNAVPSAWVSVAALGLLFYSFTTLATTFFYDRPFKTLPSLTPHSLAHFSNKYLW